MRLCALPVATIKYFYQQIWKKGCFTVSAKHNIDKNATVNLVQSHFHGTGVSIFQLLDHENQGESLDCHGFIDALFNIKQLAPLPAEYRQPRKVYRSSEELFAPLCRFNYEDLFEYPELNLAKTEQQQWSQQFSSFVDSAKSWAQYYIQEKCIQPRNIKETNSFLTRSLLCTSYTLFFVSKIGTCSKSR